MRRALREAAAAVKCLIVKSFAKTKKQGRESRGQRAWRYTASQNRKAA